VGRPSWAGGPPVPAPPPPSHPRPLHGRKAAAAASGDHPDALAATTPPASQRRLDFPTPAALAASPPASRGRRARSLPPPPSSRIGRRAKPPPPQPHARPLPRRSRELTSKRRCRREREGECRRRWEIWAAWGREFEQRLAPSDLENFRSAHGVYMAFISTGGWH